MSRRYPYSSITARPAQGLWPGGRSLAVYVAIGVEDYRHGGHHTEDLLSGVPDSAYT